MRRTRLTAITALTVCAVGGSAAGAEAAPAEFYRYAVPAKPATVHAYSLSRVSVSGSPQSRSITAKREEWQFPKDSCSTRCAERNIYTGNEEWWEHTGGLYLPFTRTGATRFVAKTKRMHRNSDWCHRKYTVKITANLSVTESRVVKGITRVEAFVVNIRETWPATADYPAGDVTTRYKGRHKSWRSYGPGTGEPPQNSAPITCFST